MTRYSNFRERARAIKAAGEAQRGNFEPHGTPLRVYNYWLENTGSIAGLRIKSGLRQENFCHFWRVVIMWAPLLFVGKKIGHALATPVGLAVTTLLGLAVFVYLLTLSWEISKLILISVGLAILLIGLAAALVIGAQYLIEKYSDDPRRAANRLVGGFLAFLGITMFGAITYGIYESDGWRGLVALAIVIVLIVGSIASFVALANFVENRRALALEEEFEARANATYEGEHVWREPSKISKFFRGVGDFMVLLAQIVRVKKWKICPMVEVKRQ